MKKALLFLVIILFTIPALLRGQNPEIDSLKNLLTSTAQDTIKMKALSDLTWYYSGQDPKEAEKYSLEELKLSKSISDKKWLALSFNDIGIYYYKLGSLDSALSYYERSLAIRKTLNDKNSIGSSLSKIGLVEQELGNYNKALENQFQALKIFEELKNEKYLAMTFNNIGLLYHKLKNYDKEIEYCDKAVDIHLKNKNEYPAAFCYGNLAAAHKMKGDLERSNEYLEKAGIIFKKYDDKSNEAGILNSIGINLRLAHKDKEALKYYHQAYDLAKQINDNLGSVLYAHNISSINTDLGNYTEAEKYSLEALKSTEKNNKSQLVLTYRQLANIYAYLNKGKLSAYYLDRYAETKDSIFTQEASSQIANMEVKYQTAQKDKELVIKDAEIIKQQADASKKAVQRNAFLLGFLLVLCLAFFILRGYRQKQKANIAITEQKDIIEEKNKEITDSIHYAKRIQKALLASESTLKNNLSEYFVLYIPKDIVSGDFYWAQNINDNFLICTADCTGHGVPGAFMSLLGISYLNEITRERHINNPAQVLEKLRSEIISNLSADDKEDGMSSVNDGMDMVLCNFRFKEMTLDFACSNNPLWLIRDKTLTEYKADKAPVGRYYGEMKSFTPQSIKLQKGDLIYTLTDGYADQFGGENGKKFKYKSLQQMLVKISALPLNEQHDMLEKNIIEWKGNLEQVDDILIIGIRV